MRILLIEDDEMQAEILLHTLTSQRYAVDHAADGMAGLDYAESAEYDLILMDVGLPRLDGIELCRRLRAGNCTTPILLMTARDAPTERIRGLDAGADDYLTKPLDLAELQARVRALLRRGAVAPNPVLQVGDLRLDPISCQVSYADKPLTLTPKEYSLLDLFLRNPSRVFSRGQILQHLWTFDDPPLEDSVKAHIKGLRQKLKHAGAVDWIENVYGIGYRLKENVGSLQAAEQKENREDEQGAAGQEAAADAKVAIAQQFSQKIDALWLQYQGLMLQRLQALQTAITALEQNTLTEELRQEAGKAAHKLAGVLGMFDREAGTTLAREIEHLFLRETNLSTRQQTRLIELVKTLEQQLDLQQPSELETEAQLLLIDSDSLLLHDLQLSSQSMGLGWKQVTNLDATRTWLRSHSPQLVAISVEAIGLEPTLQLLAELASRTPAIPTLVMAAEANLRDRVTFAQAGGQGFLAKPGTAAQIWEATTKLLQRHRSQTIQVLVVDDDPVFLGVLRSLLEPWGMVMTGLDDPLRFWDVLNAVSPDLLILDVEMPEIRGIELCQAVRLDPTWQSLPILFLTAHKDSDTVQQVFAAGADDFILKPVVGPELLTRLTNRLERNRLLQTLSSQDPITGVANQPQSYRDLELLWQQATDSKQPFCLAVLSVAELRPIVLEHGHAAANQVLQSWGRVFRSSLTTNEPVGYWGNGEFVMGIVGLTPAEVNDRLSDILQTLRRQVFTAPDSKRFQATCRVAIAEATSTTTTLHHLYQAATAKL